MTAEEYISIANNEKVTNNITDAEFLIVGRRISIHCLI
jgi:hypothetical protein